MRSIFLASLLVSALSAQAPFDVKLLDALQYRYIGPANMGGRTADVEGVPGNPRIVYAGTGGGGLFKSVNAGLTWSPLFDRAGATVSVGDLVLDPRNPETIWLGTGEANMRNSVSFGDGVYKSTDGGKTWSHLGLKETEHIARVLVSPLDSNTAWVCAIGHQAAPNDERGVFLTTDGGKTWQKTLFVDDKHGCADLDIDRQNPNVLLAAVWRFERKPWNHTSGSEQSGIFRSTDGGRTWKKSTRGLPKLMGRAGVKLAPSNGNIAYAACESKEGTFYRSNDAGESWTEVTRNREVVSRGFYYADLRVDPKDENRVYAIATNLLVSIDGGKAWRNIVGNTHIDYHSLWIDPVDPNRMWHGQDGGVSVSYDRGDTWEAVTNLPLGQFYQIYADNALPFYNITGGLQDNGTWRGPSRVRQPSGITNAEWTLVSFGDGFYALGHPDNPDLLLTESQGGRILINDLKTGYQKSITPQPRSGWINQLKYRFNWNSPIVGSPHGKTTVYLGSNVLFQSRDFGSSWEPISPDLTTNNPEKYKPAGGPVWLDNSTAENNGTIITIGESPVKSGVIWVGTDDGNLQVTMDGGKAWTNVAANVAGVPAESPVSHVEPSRTNAMTAYASFDRHLLDDYRPHLFKTTDGGKSWTRLVNGLPEKAYVQVVKEDPKNPNLLYAGTETGLFASWNGGQTWQPLLLKNLSKVAVHDILVHPRENDLILGTHGRSVVILDDVTPLQQMSAEIAAKPAHLFAARPALRHATPMRAYGLGGKAYAAANPPYGALLTYYLKDKAENVKLEILDEKGAIIRTLRDAPKEQGFNRINWDLRYDGPELRRAPDPMEVTFGGGPRGPEVVPGAYKVRLTAAGQALEQKIEVKLDPTLNSPLSDLVLQRDTALKLRAMASESNTRLKKFDAEIARLAALEEYHRRTLSEADAKSANEKVAAERKTIQAQIAKYGQLAGAGRLDSPPTIEQEINGLYQQIAGNIGAPTAAELAYLADVEARYKEIRP
ncbi:MAG: hypothetical protein JNL98_04270 [Bryobacterales bacterium]|nr:hypothetical protein [Bryobacterales bacterium]